MHRTKKKNDPLAGGSERCLAEDHVLAVQVGGGLKPSIGVSGVRIQEEGGGFCSKVGPPKGGSPLKPTNWVPETKTHPDESTGLNRKGIQETSLRIQETSWVDG